jgi:hypothetical protein
MSINHQAYNLLNPEYYSKEREHIEILLLKPAGT